MYVSRKQSQVAEEKRKRKNLWKLSRSAYLFLTVKAPKPLYMTPEENRERGREGNTQPDATVEERRIKQKQKPRGSHPLACMAAHGNVIERQRGSCQVPKEKKRIRYSRLKRG